MQALCIFVKRHDIVKACMMAVLVWN